MTTNRNHIQEALDRLRQTVGPSQPPQATQQWSYVTPQANWHAQTVGTFVDESLPRFETITGETCRMISKDDEELTVLQNIFKFDDDTKSLVTKHATENNYSMFLAYYTLYMKGETK